MFNIPFLSILTLSAQTEASFQDRQTRQIATLARIVRTSLLLSALFLVISLISLAIGPGEVDWSSLLRALLQDPSENVADREMPARTILFSIRLPRILFAGMVGGALAAAGTVFQALLRNPLADPYVLGISGGAAVGAIAGIIIGAGAFPLGVSGLAFSGSLFTMMLVFGTAGVRTDLQTGTLLLTGVIINAFFSAVILFLLATSSDGHLHSVLFWLMGDLSLAEGGDVMLMGMVLLAGFGVMTLYARSLNLMVTGEETAMQLGVDVARTKKILFTAASLLTAVAVSISGIIGFVGLIIPHLLRLILGPDHRLLLPASVLFGGAFLVAADTLARTIMAPVELPVGVVTALCGAPYFIYLLRRRVV